MDNGLIALYDKGTVIFGTAEVLDEWLSEPSFGLGNHIPKSLLDTTKGIEMVTEELIRIEYGDLA